MLTQSKVAMAAALRLPQDMVHGLRLDDIPCHRTVLNCPERQGVDDTHSATSWVNTSCTVRLCNDLLCKRWSIFAKEVAQESCYHDIHEC